MTNLETYNKIFSDVFNVDSSSLDDLKYQGIEQWDSVGHMNLIAELENSFGIMFDTEDIIGFDSYEKGKEILRENYNIVF